MVHPRIHLSDISLLPVFQLVPGKVIVCDAVNVSRSGEYHLLGYVIKYHMKKINNDLKHIEKAC
jgi:hypothetical protein